MSIESYLSQCYVPGTSPGYKAYKTQDPLHCLESWTHLTGKEQENWEIFAVRITGKREVSRNEK